jgi:hypothetical protein
MIIVFADGVCPNETHDVRPMKGGIVQPSTETFTSVRGDVTLKTRSASMKVPFRPVTSSIRVRSCFELCASATLARRPRQAPRAPRPGSSSACRVFP